MTVPDPSSQPVGLKDGRRLRSSRSRAKIVDATLKLLRAGATNPSTAKIAAAAKVSLRTVFRHFEDMDSLYREMGAIVALEVMPLYHAPYDAEDWQGQLREMISRRAKIYECILPIKATANIRRFRSKYLMVQHAQFLKLERVSWEIVLPKELTSQTPLFEALQMVTSFDAWYRLRADQGLSFDASEAVLSLTVKGLICKSGFTT